MCKKILGVGVLGAVVAASVVGTGAWSYVRTGISTAHQTVKDSVPIEWEIKRARDMIRDLNPEIEKNLAIVVKESVGVEKLAAKIDSNRSLLAKSRDEILQLKGDLESGSVRYVYAGESFTQDEVKDELSHRFKEFQAFEKTTNTLSKQLAARERNLHAAKRKLEEMMNAKDELEVEIESLQARQTMVEVAQTSSTLNLDDSQLSKTRELLDDIATRIDVAEKMVASEGILQGRIELNTQDSPELLDEIATYFDASEEAEVKVLLSNHEL